MTKVKLQVTSGNVCISFVILVRFTLTNQPKGSEYEHKDNDEKKKSNEKGPTAIFTKKENAALAQHIEILDWYHTNGKNQSKTAKHFDLIYPNLKLKQPLISAWVKDEMKWREEWTRSSGAHTAKRARQMQHPEVTEMM